MVNHLAPSIRSRSADGSSKNEVLSGVVTKPPNSPIRCNGTIDEIFLKLIS